MGLAPMKFSNLTIASLICNTSAKTGMRMGIKGDGWRIVELALESEGGCSAFEDDGVEGRGLYGSIGYGRACIAIIMYLLRKQVRRSGGRQRRNSQRER